VRIGWRGSGNSRRGSVVEEKHYAEDALLLLGKQYGVSLTQRNMTGKQCGGKSLALWKGSTLKGKHYGGKDQHYEG
jgi:hypothetical protein